MRPAVIQKDMAMSGKPAARMGDMTQYGGPIVQGSAGVMIGAPTGVACSVCPDGITSGSPVNPLLGAKVLPGETDIALPGPLPFLLTRTYSSYRTRTPAPVGLFGPGWKSPSDIVLQIQVGGLILNDNGGRSIHFAPLLPGETAFSRTELFWLARGGVDQLHESNPLHSLWQTLPEDLRLSQHTYLAINSLQGPWWILGWTERVPGIDEALPPPLPPYRLLTGLADRFGRTLTYHREAAGEFTGHITAVTDGAGRRFRLMLSTRPERARQQGLPAYPDAPVATRYGQDSGIRLDAVWLTLDPEFPDALPAAPLARYMYSPAGELAAVYDRGDVQVRRFAYDPAIPGRMVAHGHAGRPETTYRYDATGRVTEQHNPAGLSYRYDYARDQVAITDSLNRREVLHTEGEGGLKRVVKKEHADGSVTLSAYNPLGWLIEQTDAAGRKTQYRHNIASGDITGIVTPDGRLTEFYHTPQRQLKTVKYPDGLDRRLTWDAQGRLTAETSREGNTTRYGYEGPCSEYPSILQDASGSQKQITRNHCGQILAFTDCSGYRTCYEYNRFGQVTAIHQEEGLSQYFSYNGRGQPVSRTDTDGHETRYAYNDAGDLTTVILPDGSRSETRYDAAGRAVSTTQDGLTRQLSYDAAGRITRLTNENGSHCTLLYDVLDRLTQQTGFDGRTQRYQHDATGRLTRSEDEDLITLWHYDASDRLTHRSVNGEPAEHWHYDDRGWLTEISHLSEGHRVAVHYRYDTKGRLVSERQTVQAPDTAALLWQHETTHAWNEQGQANRFRPDSLPPVEWLTYGSGYLAGMKLGDTPLTEFTRDRLHRETLRHFGTTLYALSTAWAPGGQLQSHHLNSPQPDRNYGYDAAGQLVRISGPLQVRDYDYGPGGRLTGVHTRSDSQENRASYLTDPAGNRLAAHGQSATAWPDNRIHEDAYYLYHHDRHGRLTEKTARTPVEDGHSQHYRYDSQHRLVHFIHTRHNTPRTESRHLYDPLGRRTGKQVREQGSPIPSVTWYGWDGDRLVTTQTAQTRIQTIYEPGSFTPLIRVETATAELDALRHHRTLAQKLQQDGNEAGYAVRFPPELVAMLDRLEGELRAGTVSAESHQWLAGCGLTPERMAAQLENLPVPARNIHLYHCDHRGLPLALVNEDGTFAWRGEYDEWGNLLYEDNPHHLTQSLRLPGQQYDEESGLHYNRYRYYDPQQGRYITQDPVGLKGGWNLYLYPLNPVQNVDPLGCTSLVIHNGPVPDNPFGHGALAIDNEGVISFGTGDDKGISLKDYFKKMQPRRDSVIWLIHTTPEEESCMKYEIKKIRDAKKGLGIGYNNCFSRTNEIFENCGMKNPQLNTNTPFSLQVLGEMYGSKRMFIPKDNFQSLPAALDNFKDLSK